MDPVQRLLAIEDIKRLKARYFRATDTRQTEEYLDCYTEDIVWTWLGDDNVTVLKEIRSRDEFRAYLKSIEPNRMAGFSVHHFHNPEIDIIDENHATAIWAMFDYVHNPGDKHFMGYGHYHDELRREADGKWRISKSYFTRLHVDRFEDDKSYENYTE